MHKPYDATLNYLSNLRPGEWGRYFASRLDLPPGPVVELDTDLATTIQADKVYRVGGPQPAVLHLEFESAGELGTPTRLFRYNSLLTQADEVPVHTVLILLHPRANSSDRTGVYVRRRRTGRPYLRFEYDVIRVWEESFDGWLAAGPTLAPLALLTREANDSFEPALRRFGRWMVETRVDHTLGREMIGAAFNLCGLWHDERYLHDLYRGLHMDKIMRHSTTYQWLRREAQAEGRAEGRAEGELAHARRTLLRLGRKRFGEPSAATHAAVESVGTLARLDELSDRLLEVNSWDELLTPP